MISLQEKIKLKDDQFSQKNYYKFISIVFFEAKLNIKKNIKVIIIKWRMTNSNESNLFVEVSRDNKDNLLDWGHYRIMFCLFFIIILIFFQFVFFNFLLTLLTFKSWDSMTYFYFYLKVWF